MDELLAVPHRPELLVAPVEAPPRLAPWTWAMRVEADPGRPAAEDLDEPDTSGRLVLLHDPGGREVWQGSFRFVCFVQARLEPGQLGDDMLPDVAWSWLTEALEQSSARYTALGGTITQTSSVRFGERAEPGAPGRDDDIELRAAWTPLGDQLVRHAEAFCQLVASAAGLPPIGAVPLARRTV